MQTVSRQPTLPSMVMQTSSTFDGRTVIRIPPRNNGTGEELTRGERGSVQAVLGALQCAGLPEGRAFLPCLTRPRQLRIGARLAGYVAATLPLSLP